jgi:hypothetical protein
LLKNSKCSESLQTGRERRPRRCEPSATHFVSNGRQEREILQSVWKVKQAKKGDADCIVYSPYRLTWQGRTSVRRRGRGDVDDSWVNRNATRGIFLINGKVPRGPVMGCHVAPLYWLMV